MQDNTKLQESKRFLPELAVELFQMIYIFIYFHMLKF